MCLCIHVVKMLFDSSLVERFYDGCSRSPYFHLLKFFAQWLCITAAAAATWENIWTSRLNLNTIFSNSLPFTLSLALPICHSFSRHAWTCSWINATQTVTFQHAFNALKFIRKIEQSILPEIDYLCAFLWSQSPALQAVIKESMNALTKTYNHFPLAHEKMSTSCFIVEFSRYTLVFHSHLLLTDSISISIANGQVVDS